MKKIATLAVAGLLGLGLATSADAQQRPMGASGSGSMSSGSMSSMPAKAPAKKVSAKKTSMSDVKAVQTALNKNGASLKVDGKMGKGTRAALKSYQKSNGLMDSGRLDDATKAKLGV